MGDGGPAFPSGETRYRDGIGGMSLRDYFAGQVINGLVSTLTSSWQKNYGPELAKIAYEVADAMLEARK
jgi:hypothetical protein